MKTTSKLLAAAGLVLASLLLWSGTPARAVTVTFGTTAAGNIGQTYTEGGFLFTAGTVNGLYIAANQVDSNIALVNYNLPDTITLTRSGGGNFNLDSIDFLAYGAPLPHADLTYSWIDANGTPSAPISTSLPITSWSHFLLSLTNIRSFSWTANLSGNAIWADNVVATPVSSTPIPAALPLFASALGVLGFAKRRQRKQA
jgi:hypothetical protein